MRGAVALLGLSAMAGVLDAAVSSARPARLLAARTSLASRPSTRGRVLAQAERAPKAGEPGDEASLASKGAWYATELFGAAAALVRGEPAIGSSAIAGPPRSLKEAIARLESDYERRYFLLGVMDEALYAEDCEFADAFVSFKGRERFVGNLANLAGGFISDSSVRTLSASLEPEGSYGGPAYTTRLLVKLQLALPWKPTLAWVWGVTHIFDERTLLVTRHLERWEVSAAEGVRQLLTPGPPDGIAQGRTTQQAPSQVPQAATAPPPQLDPILGPLVRLGRSLKLLGAEPEGWEGEPTAWAERDSLAQRLSKVSAERLGGFKLWVAEVAVGKKFDPVPVDARIAAETSARGVFMYSFPGCPFCRKAKAVLEAEGAKFTVVELDSEADGPQIRARVGRLTGRTSMPAIWVGGEYIGGCNDGGPAGGGGLVGLAESGQLRSMLKRAGAIR
ncbi:hypothetical protein T492DRAFT_618289 [Pavlovales sp. CCMP2436]|nr:hypothetical protein T492DRAFT_618289 [Pavlovales sp. CCMP2436]